MKDLLITKLRNRNTTSSEFRETASKLSDILAVEISQYVPKKSINLQTPLAKTNGSTILSSIVTIPILRAGLAMLPSFLSYYENAKVGFIGLKRDEKTFLPHLYYQNIPSVSSKDTIIIVDPMLATGGSLIGAIRLLIEKYSIQERHILYAGIIASKQGVSRLTQEFPLVKYSIAQVDASLSSKKYIIPGLGDFGDRFFG